MTTAVRLSAARVRVCFRHVGDRFSHAVEVLDPTDQWQSWLTSIEGTANELWPPGPVLQSLHVEDRGGGVQVALLVGMAGRSHWSMSVEADPGLGLSFDLACRLRDVPGFLGSSYEVGETAAEKPIAQSGGWRWSGRQQWLEIEPDAAISRAVWEWQAPQHLAMRLEVGEAPLPATFRWRYRVRGGRLSA